MSPIKTSIEIILHLDKYLDAVMGMYGNMTYIILFLIIFLETGLVVTPFLPGDSLLFVAGALATKGTISVVLLWVLLSIAAILGDTVNYGIGKYFGEKIFSKSRLFKQEYLDQTKEFYKKHGGKTIVFARFIPIIRTFAPFVAGIAKMKYGEFISLNILGGILWVALFIFGGYFFGNIPFIQENFSIVIIIMILVSMLPLVKELVKSRYKKIP